MCRVCICTIIREREGGGGGERGERGREEEGGRGRKGQRGKGGEGVSGKKKKREGGRQGGGEKERKREGRREYTSLVRIPPILPKDGILIPYLSNSFFMALISSSAEGGRDGGSREGEGGRGGEREGERNRGKGERKRVDN